VAFGVFFAVGAVFAYRGWAARDQMMYLDEIFVGESLQPRLAMFRGFTNMWGETIFLQPFSGYLHTVVRALIELILLGPLSQYPAWTYTLSTVVWSGCALLLYFAIKDVVGVTGGVLAALLFPLLHASNIILLGQLNALQWPMLVAAVITVATDFTPRTKFGSVLYAVFLIATALNAALAFIPLLMLGWRVLVFPKRKKWRDLVYFTLMAAPYTLQVLSYRGQRIRVVDGRNPWSYMWNEIGYVPKLLLPGHLRGSVIDNLTPAALLLLVGFLIVLVATVVVGIVMYFRSSRRVARVIIELMLVSVVTAILSVYLNGNLNHQYVLIPTMTAWVAVIIALHGVLHSARWKMWGQWATMGAVGIFVFSSVGLWKNSYSDPFFGPTTGTQLDDAIEKTQSWCINKDDEDLINLTGYSINLPCHVIRELR
jgi:hypothetical protein